MNPKRGPCPGCGGPVSAEAICPGYWEPAERIWARCYPPCGNGTLYECANGLGCSWWYIEGMSRSNMFYHSNKQRKPPWLSE